MTELVNRPDCHSGSDGIVTHTHRQSLCNSAEECWSSKPNDGSSNLSRGSIFEMMRDSSVVEHLAHNQAVAGSIPAPATNRCRHEAQPVEHPLDKRAVVSSILTMPTNARIAQLGERLPYKQGVVGSSPTLCTTSACNSVGRVPVFQTGCRRFETDHALQLEERTHSTMVVRPAHNGLVPGSSPGGSTTRLIPGSSSDGQSTELLPRLSGVRIPSARPFRRRRRCIPQTVAPGSDLLSLMIQFDSGLGFHRLCAGNSMVEYLAFNQGVASSSLARRTIRLAKKRARSSMVEQQTLNLLAEGSSPSEPTIHRSVVQLVGCRSPKPMITVRVRAGLPNDSWRSVHGAVGSAQPCQGWGRGFKPHCTLQAGIAQLVEHVLGMDEVVGSIPTPSSNAPVAQLVEHLFRTQEVSGSIPLRSSNAGVAQLVERLPCKQRVGGSIPLTGPKSCGGLAQLGEHLPCKQDVVGSIPTTSTKWTGSSVGRALG